MLNMKTNIADKLSTYEIKEKDKALRDGLASWYYKYLNQDDLYLVTLTTKAKKGFDKTSFVPTKENLMNKMRWILVEIQKKGYYIKYKDKTTFRTQPFQWVWYYEDSYNRMNAEKWNNPHIHGLCDHETAYSVTQEWKKFNIGYTQIKEIDQPLLAMRYVCKDLVSVDEKFDPVYAKSVENADNDPVIQELLKHQANSSMFYAK